MCRVKNKIAILGPGRYCLPIRYKDGSEPLEWGIDIEYCHWANFFIGIHTLLSTAEYNNITTYNIVLAIFLPSAASCVPIFFFLMNHPKWLHKNESKTQIDIIGMFCNPGNQIGAP